MFSLSVGSPFPGESNSFASNPPCTPIREVRCGDLTDADADFAVGAPCSDSESDTRLSRKATFFLTSYLPPAPAESGRALAVALAPTAPFTIFTLPLFAQALIGLLDGLVFCGDRDSAGGTVTCSTEKLRMLPRGK